MSSSSSSSSSFSSYSSSSASSHSIGNASFDNRKPWWLTNRKIVDKYIREARSLISTREHRDVVSALSLLDAALALSPRLEVALELKARSLLYLRRYKDVANMLQDYIPSLKLSKDDSDFISSDSSSHQASSSSSSSKEQMKKLLSSASDSSQGHESGFKCFSVSELKKKIMAGLRSSCEKEQQWRYMVLGQACCQLGLMEDAMALLQTGKRLANAAINRESVYKGDDSFSLSTFPISSEIIIVKAPGTPPQSESEPGSINQLLAHIKFLLRRRTAAIAALDAGLFSESIRHFTKIVEGRYGAPRAFLAQCYMYRASAYQSAGRVAEAIADCNRTLALDPTCIEALETRASLLERIRCLPDCLHDLEHLKLLYNTILRDRKLPGPAWKQHSVHYGQISGKLCSLASKIEELKRRVASGETGNVDYYALMGLKRGCSRAELERAYLLLSLRHKPDRTMSFLDRCEFADDCDLDSVKDRARMSALLLYRLLQKGYARVKSTIMEEEIAEKQRKQAAVAAALQAEHLAIQVQQSHEVKSPRKPQTSAVPKTPAALASDKSNQSHNNKVKESTDVSAYKGVFCRDLPMVENLLSQVGFNRPLTVKYAALSC